MRELFVLMVSFVTSAAHRAFEVLDGPSLLIPQLGDADFNVREAASRTLAATPQAAPWVRRATRHADPEIANRARELSRNFSRKHIAALSSRISPDQLDLFLDWYLAWQPVEVDTLWNPCFELSRRGGEVHAERLPANTKSGLNAVLPRSLEHLKTLTQDPIRTHDGPGGTFSSGCWLIRTNTLTSRPNSLRVVVARGVVGQTDIWRAILGTLDQFHSDLEIASSTVFCHGDVKPAPKSGRPYVVMMSGSFLVTRGNVIGPHVELSSTVILAGGDVNVGPGCHLKGSTIIAGGKVTIPKSARVENCIIKENVKNPTAPFTFFEVADVGLTLGTAAKGLPVGDVKPDSPFGKAGVKKGDTILAVDDAPPGDPEAFRVKLRRAIVVQGDVLLTVSRDGKTLDLPVYFPLPK